MVDREAAVGVIDDDALQAGSAVRGDLIVQVLGDGLVMPRPRGLAADCGELRDFRKAAAHRGRGGRFSCGLFGLRLLLLVPAAVLEHEHAVGAGLGVAFLRALFGNRRLIHRRRQASDHHGERMRAAHVCVQSSTGQLGDGILGLGEIGEGFR
ncbi:hypothetical protein D3C81_1184720 [compost metagenome]